MFANRAVKPSVTHREYALKHAGLALHHAAASADFSGSARAARYCARPSRLHVAHAVAVQLLSGRAFVS